MQKNTGFKRIVKAGYYSYKGLRFAFTKEAAFRQEVLVAAVMIPFAYWLPVTNVERILLVSAVVFVLVVELLNSGIEATIDRIGPEYHELAGLAKDLGSAAVLVSIGLGLFVWLSILVPVVLT